MTDGITLLYKNISDFYRYYLTLHSFHVIFRNRLGMKAVYIDTSIRYSHLVEVLELYLDFSGQRSNQVIDKRKRSK